MAYDSSGDSNVQFRLRTTDMDVGLDGGAEPSAYSLLPCREVMRVLHKSSESHKSHP